MIDEVYCFYVSVFYMNLMKVLFNCVKIGFIGIFIVVVKKKKIVEIFGGWIDKYMIKEF